MFINILCLNMFINSIQYSLNIFRLFYDCVENILTIRIEPNSKKCFSRFLLMKLIVIFIITL